MNTPFDNSFAENFEDVMTATAILDDCVDKEKKSEFFKSIIPHTILEQKYEKLIDVMKHKREDAPVESEGPKLLAKSFLAEFEQAGK
jgi:hypothetical protein